MDEKTITMEEKVKLMRQLEKEGLCKIQWHSDEVGEMTVKWLDDKASVSAEEEKDEDGSVRKVIKVKVSLTLLKELWRRINVVETRAERIRVDLGNLIDEAESK